MKAGRKRKYKVTPMQIAVRVATEADKKEIKALEHTLLNKHRMEFTK